MANPTKKGAKKAKAKPPRATAKKSPPKTPAQSVQSTRRELITALEQQNATSEILRMIARSPANIQSVMDTIAASAARLCEAKDALIFRVDGDVQKRVAVYGAMPTTAIGMRGITRGTPVGRAIIDRETIHVHDIAEEIETEFAEYRAVQKATGIRTALATPLMRDGVPIGVINVRRMEVRPFTDKQIKLLKTFADQAVIAIENARLFQERETSNRDLAALHDVTTAASRSLEIKPVLDEVIRKITEIFAFDSMSIFLFDRQNEYLNRVASYAPHDEAPSPRAFRRGQGLTGRVAETGEPIIFENVKTDPRYQELSQTKATQQRDHCFFALFPIKSKERFLGTITCLGKLPRKLSAEEVRLISSMCDQIGVAVENINLFEDVKNKTSELESSNSELREALEQQTATSEILRVIAKSPNDIQPVLDIIAENAAQLCGADDAVIRRVEGDSLSAAAHFGSIRLATELGRLDPIERGGFAGRAVQEGRTLHVHDLVTAEAEFPGAKERGIALGVRTALAVPLLRDGKPIGLIHIRRLESPAFY